MNYVELNREQKKLMKSTCNINADFTWEDNNIFDILLGKLPSIRRLNNSEKIKALVWDLEKYYQTYDAFNTDQCLFLESLKAKIQQIRDIEPFWYGLDLFDIERALKQHRFCLISGEGGIGKSYFVMKLEEKLENLQIPHLCIYGKFKKELSDIDFAEIEAAKRFILIFDAINEVPQSCQYALISQLKKLKQIRGCRIIVTYRTNKIDQSIKHELESLASDCFSFPGVSFESALDCLTRLGVSNVYLYEDILYSNNPLLLSYLEKVLSSYKITKQTLNNITSITFIFEQYIKHALDPKHWLFTKTISEWMYRNNEKSISREKIIELVPDDTASYLSNMLQMGFLITYQLNDGVDYFEFGLESLSDFLIARNLFDELPKDDIQGQITLIKSKLDKMYYLREAIILVLFDRFSPDYSTIRLLLNETGLIDRFYWETLRKVIFKEENITAFQTSFKTDEIEETFKAFAGYTSQPLNCTYYFNNLFIEKEYQLKLSEILSGEHFHTSIISRLKNILYTLSIGSASHSRIEEAFWFSLWCCAAPNTNIRCLALKLLFDVVHSHAEYQHTLISIYPSIIDHYIQDAIIQVLSKCDTDLSEEIHRLFQYLIDDESFILARSLRRIAAYMDTPYCYIEWKKVNLRDDNYCVSEDLDSLIRYADLVDSNFLPFKYFGNAHIEMYKTFLDVNKDEITQWNKELRQRFQCVNSHSYCCGHMGFARKAEERFNRHYTDAQMSPFTFYKTFAKVATDILNMYPVEKQNGSWKHPDFAHSLVRKCFDISVDIVLGSFMCNYFSNNFGTHNNTQDCLGYEVYDPLVYEDELPITSPIPNYHNESEVLCDSVVSRLELPQIKDETWVRDASLTRRNILSLQIPIKRKQHEWIMIAGRISWREADDHLSTLWVDTYDYWCCTSAETTLLGDGNDRYLTIELEDFHGTLSSYASCQDKPWLCKQIPSLGSSSLYVFDETGLVLPPAELIAHLRLKADTKNMTWVNSDNEIVLYCNNSKYSYYSSVIGSSVFMRKDIYEEYLKEKTLKFFAFSERYHPNTGYADETSLHFEIEHGQIIREFNNYCVKPRNEPEQPDECKNCPYGFNSTSNETISEYQNLLKELKYIYDDLDCNDYNPDSSEIEG